MNGTDPLTISPALARRLAVRSQALDRVPETSGPETILSTIEQLGCLQIDPLNVVARSPLLVLWSRLGNFKESDLNHLAWEDRALFEYWAHAASLVLTDDFPIYQAQMRTFGRGGGVWGQRVRDWLEVNDSFRRAILDELARRGPLYAEEIEDRAVVPWESSGWTNTRNVSTMLGLLWEQGDITVTRRVGKGFGLKKQWGLFEHHMPQWVEHEPWPSDKVVSEAAQRALKALGVATERQITNYFIRNGYPDLGRVLANLQSDGRVHPVNIREDDTVWPGEWFIHVDTLPALAQLQDDGWQPRTALLSPFDNLIADRARTEQLFDFTYRSEIYTPKAKRQYGYYVMPILYGERLIGRVDPKIDRKTKTLHVYAVHREESVDEEPGMAREIAEAIGELGRFLGAECIAWGEQIAPEWTAVLQAETNISG